MADLFKTFTERVAPQERRASQPRLAAGGAASGKVPYEALGTKDKTLRLDLRCENFVGHSLAYAYLVNVTYDRRDYDRIFITGSGLVVTIKGRALRPVIEALKLQCCDFIQAFDAEEFEAPTDLGAPYVQSISVEVIRGLEGASQEAKMKEST